MSLKKIRKAGRSCLAMLLCACMVLSLFSAAVPTAAEEIIADPVTNGVVKREADPSTMDTYRDMLNIDENSRYAGRLWTDKSVFAYDGHDIGDRSTQWNTEDHTLKLTPELDGVEGGVKSDADFLEVLSVLGSSENDEFRAPGNVVIVIDNSGSMYNNGLSETDADDNEEDEGSNSGSEDEAAKKLSDLTFSQTRIYKTVDAVNRAIDSIMEMGSDNQVAVVAFGDYAEKNTMPNFSRKPSEQRL